jgi:hypothetical protein
MNSRGNQKAKDSKGLKGRGGRGGKREGAGRKAKPKEIDPIALLKVRKQLYIDGLSKGKTKLQAGLDAGYAESTARNAKSHIETKDVQEAFSQLIQRTIPPEKIAARILEGMDATETKFYSYQGLVFDQENVIAWDTRLDATRMAAEYGKYHVQKTKVEGEVEVKGPLVILTSVPRPGAAEKK